MKLTKKNLLILIENFLKENVPFETRGIVSNPDVSKDWKKFLELLGYYTCKNETGGKPQFYVKLNSGKRNGASQVNAWLEKMISGESKEDTINLYSTRNRHKDPFMSKETEENAKTAYAMIEDLLEKEKITPAQLKKKPKLYRHISKYLDENQVSSHQKGTSIDLMYIDKNNPHEKTRSKVVKDMLKRLKMEGYANFHYQIEKSPYHFHLGQIPGKELLTKRGKDKLIQFRRMYADCAIFTFKSK